MTNVHEQIKELRTGLYLSQNYVAKFLVIDQDAYAQMENGKRKILADEAAQLSNLFGVSAGSLLNNTEMIQSVTLFGQEFEELDGKDREGIVNLIRFKGQILKRRNLNAAI